MKQHAVFREHAAFPHVRVVPCLPQNGVVRLFALKFLLRRAVTLTFLLGVPIFCVGHSSFFSSRARHEGDVRCNMPHLLWQLVLLGFSRTSHRWACGHSFNP